MARIHITDLELAINYWRSRAPSDASLRLSPATAVLAEVYGRMVFSGACDIEERQLSVPALEAWLTWYATTPDTPCVAICSTAQGDDWCKGCGRSFEEVQHWTNMQPAQKRQTWRRILTQGTAWRFNRYADRVVAAPASSGQGK